MLSNVMLLTFLTLTAAVALWTLAVRWMPQREQSVSLANLGALPLPAPVVPKATEPDAFAGLMVEAVSDSKISTIAPTAGERLSSADITLLLSNATSVVVDRVWIAVPGCSSARLHLEVNGTPMELDAEGRCVKRKPLMRPNDRWRLALTHSWVPKGPSVAESDEAIPVIVTLEFADESQVERKSLRLLCKLAPPREARLYLDGLSARQLVQRVYERNIASMQLLKG